MTNTLTLPIQVGKKYVRRNGQVVEISFISESEGAYTDQDHEAIWEKSGKQYGGSRETPFDLVADYIEPEQAKGHPHAALMLQYAQDWAETDRPWERWQWRHGTNEPWVAVEGSHPSWNPHTYYRRKPEPPKTIRIGEFDVPEPLREEPGHQTRVYTPSISDSALFHSSEWVGQPHQQYWLDRGLAHLTREAAELHAKALLSFTEVKS